MFNETYEQRLASWRKFRESLETDDDPFRSVIDFYNKSPYVSRHTDPWTQSMWPDPWELVNENQYDDFCRVLGMCYSLQLTERFKGCSFEIHICTNRANSELYYLLFVDDTVINWDNNYVHKSKLPQELVSQEVYSMDYVH